MLRSLSGTLLVWAALAGGCVPTDFLHPDTSATPVPSSPFSTPASVNAKPSGNAKPPQAAAEVAIAVDNVGQKLVSANKTLGMKPVFLTIGAPQPEIFHRDTSVVFITEGLAKQCKSEAQLAAVLSVELGRMVSEREALASPETHNPTKSPPIAVTMGNAGQFSGLDQLQQAEVAKLDADRRRPGKRFVPPDPIVLARGYLDAAGFDKNELETVGPLLGQAEKNYDLEKQFKTQN